jgi:hypothetical protein
MDKQFVNGMVFKLPADNAPDFAKGRISVKLDEFVAWARPHLNNGWVAIDLKVGRGGKPYAELNTWKPKTDDPPF